MRVLATGGLGFIGSAFLRRSAPAHEVVTIDAHTYAGDPARIEGIDVATERLDVADPNAGELVTRFRPEIIVHFAAETHVTRSETAEDLFFRTNVEGTRNLLDSAIETSPQLFIHVSTDEVYGPASAHPFREEDKEPGEGRATSAYARSKAVADDLALSYADRLPVVVVRPTNCFGPWQHPEKAVARWTVRALTGEGIPVWGDGLYVRDWMFVDDACAAIWTVAEKGTPGEIYNIGPQGEIRTNLEIARTIARAAGRQADAVYLTDYDRPAHDRRYSVDAGKLRSLGWAPSQSIETRLEETVDWYRANAQWWKPLVDDAEALYEDVRPREDA
jgi:dTDP-glucose 4,6-dehydratase